MTTFKKYTMKTMMKLLSAILLLVSLQSYGQFSAGPDQTVLCAPLPGGTVTMAGISTGTWTAQSNNPGTATITNPSNPAATIINFSVEGTYHFIWSNGSLRDTAAVNVYGKPYAGADQTICVYDTAITTAATYAGHWSQILGPLSSIFNSNSPTTHIEFYHGLVGSFQYVWASTSTGCTDTLQVIVDSCLGGGTAGPDQTTCNLAYVTMAAAGSGTWSALASNPHPSWIDNPSSATTVIGEWNYGGVYGYVWTTGTGRDTMYVTVTSAASAYPVVSVSMPTICAGTTVTFTAAPVNGGTNQTYQWYDHGVLVGTSADYTTSNLYHNNYPNYNDTIQVVMTSNSTCAPNPTTYIRDGIVTVYPIPATPRLYSHGTCAPTDTLIAPNSGTNLDTLEWWSGGQVLYQSLAGDSFYIPSVAGTYTTRVVSYYGCNSAFSNSVVVGSCGCTLTLIDSSITPASCGSSNGSIFFHRPAGTAPFQYKMGVWGTWQSTVGFINLPAGIDTFYVSDAAGCLVSTIDTIGSIGSITPSVTIVASQVPVCNYWLDTLYATPVNQGPSPTYVWYINGVAQAGNNFTEKPLYNPVNNGDSAWVVMTNNQSCASPHTVSSNHIYFTNGTPITPAVIVSASHTSLCGGQVDTFSALPVNAGTSPHYQWYKNGIAVGSNSPAYITSSLANNDSVWVVMTSSAPCASPASANGNVIHITVNSISVSPSSNSPVAPGDTIKLSANPTGSVSTYSWSGPGGFTSTVQNPIRTTAVIANSGTYSVTVTNSSGCSATGSVSVVVANCNITLLDTITSPGCSYNSGNVHLGATGGTAPYQYKNGINGTWQSSGIFTGIAAGTDTFYVKDAVTCSKSVVAVITRSNTYPSVAPTSNSPVTVGGTLNLTANATGSISTYSWTGPNGFTSTSANPTITNVTTAAGGTYHCTVATGGTASCNANGGVNVVITGTANAGPDKTVNCVTLPGGTATMAAVGSGTWTAQSGNPGTAIITTPSSPTTTITSFTAAGVYSFIWTSGGQTDIANVTVSATPAAPVLTQIGSCLGQDSLRLTGAGGAIQYDWQLNGTSVHISYTNQPYTLAGINGFGTAANQLNETGSNGSGSSNLNAIGICTDAAGNIYVTDILNNRVQKFPPGSTSGTNGVTVAGGNGAGTAANQFSDPADVFVAANGDLYVSDYGNNRVQKFPAGSTSATNGITVAGILGQGFDRDSMVSFPSGIFVDAAGYLYVVDQGNDRVKKFPPNSHSGSSSTNVAGIGYITSGNAANELNGPSDIVVDASGNIYVTDMVNNRVQKFPAGSVAGTNAVTVAGGNGSGSAANQLGMPTSIYIDGSGSLYVTDFLHSRIQKFPAGSTSATNAVTVAGHAARGYSGDSLNFASGVCVNAAGDVFVLDGGNNRVEKYPTGVIDSFYTPTIVGSYTATYTSTAGCTSPLSNTIVVNTCTGSAGPDQTVCTTDTAVTTAATGTGIWTVLPGNPAFSQFFFSNQAVTHIEFPTAVAGTYYYTWTPSGGAADTFIVHKISCVANAGPDQTVLCATLPGGSVTMAATSTGTWTAQSGNPGTATITNVNLATTTIVNFSTSGTYHFIWTSGGHADTAAVMVYGKPNAGIDLVLPCAILPGGSVTTAATGTGTWTEALVGSNLATITNPSSPTTTITNFNLPGDYYFVWQNSVGCTDTMMVTVTTCLSDSVWPGDADHNGIADNNDLLPIGIAYGLNGFLRASYSIVWQADYCQNWGVQFLNGENAKHADCNGDGVVNANDTVAIMQNFGLTHAKTDGYGAPWRSGIPGITLLFSKDTVVAGDTLTVSLQLGDSLTSVSNIYGLAFTYHFDALVVDTTTTSFGFINSFLGNSTDKISIHKDFTTAGEVKAAVTGINHTNRSGFGVIAHFIATITTGNINGKDLSYYGNVNYISDITAIDKDGNPITINAGTDSNQVAYTPTGIHDVSYEHILIYPNPATDAFTIQADAQLVNTEYTLTDVTGRVILTGKLKGEHTQVTITDLASGVYMLQLGDHKTSYKVIRN